MENVIIILILAAIVGAIVLYFVRTKKRGGSCTGCKGCGGKCGGCTPKKKDKK